MGVNKNPRAVYEAIKVIAETYNLKYNDRIIVTINAMGDPSIMYETKMTRDWLAEVTKDVGSDVGQPNA